MLRNINYLTNLRIDKKQRGNKIVFENTVWRFCRVSKLSNYDYDASSFVFYSVF